MGDCNGRGGFTHTSYNDFEIVAANLLDNDPRRVSDRIHAHALYIDPPLGQVGMTETQVRQSGKPALIGTRPMTKVGRAVEKGESQGFMKIVVDAQSISGPPCRSAGRALRYGLVPAVPCRRRKWYASMWKSQFDGANAQYAQLAYT